MENKYLFEMRGVTKVFPGVKALDNVTFACHPDLCMRSAVKMELENQH